MTDEKQFSVEYDDEQEYDYQDRDGTTVTVKIDDFRNGASVRAYHYDEDGSRMDYNRFQINSVDDRRLVLPNADDETVLSDAVLRALHAGGWQLGNLHQGDLTPEDDDPFEVQMLDIRDGFYDYAKQTNSELIAYLFESLARALEMALVLDFSARSAEMQEEFESPDAAIKDVAEARGGPELDIPDLVEGWMVNAAKPETQTSVIHHEETVEQMEEARRAYRSGEDFGEAFEEAQNGDTSP